MKNTHKIKIRKEFKICVKNCQIENDDHSVKKNYKSILNDLNGMKNT